MPDKTTMLNLEGLRVVLRDALTGIEEVWQELDGSGGRYEGVGVEEAVALRRLENAKQKINLVIWAIEEATIAWVKED
jgi:heme-degrading monooxygenase HmoA